MGNIVSFFQQVQLRDLAEDLIHRLWYEVLNSILWFYFILAYESVIMLNMSAVVCYQSYVYSFVVQTYLKDGLDWRRRIYIMNYEQLHFLLLGRIYVKLLFIIGKPIMLELFYVWCIKFYLNDEQTYLLSKSINMTL